MMRRLFTRRFTSITALVLSAVAVATLTACSSAPPAADWQIEARKATARGIKAYLSGAQRAAQAEFTLAQREVSATGRFDVAARVALSRCAAQVAALDLSPCSAFEPLRAYVPAPELAYAQWLEGKAVNAADLPEQYRAVAAAGDDAAAAAAVAQIADPLSRLIAAGAVFARNQASPALIQTAINTSSEQGWSRALLGWLKVELARAQQAGATDAVAQLQARIALVESGFTRSATLPASGASSVNAASAVLTK